MIFATTIVLLHSIIPHSHHSELTHEEHLEQHENASSILDFLSLAFHLDHEDGQLEEFIQGSNIDFDHIFPVYASTSNSRLQIVACNKDEESYAILDDVYPLRSIHTPSGLRAPPSLS